MGHNDHMGDHEDYDDLEELIASGELEDGSDAHGIAKQWADRGYDSLSERQIAVLDRSVFPLLKSLRRSKSTSPTDWEDGR